ncbi:3-dehydroquinate synthase II [Desulfonatronovibrio hydrogenovorans]|uniref:3-dehydroquinate synthase II n=1 Tax=Desulfonatronovibrio hydrogenovorans TaxID=53245 RepID=UPI00048C0E36|nr:3-dehydroquinate synthase II [Desulfonatronovibrio hydrogenovorans]
MSRKIYFKAVPFDKSLVTLALESGVDALLTEKKDMEKISALGRTEVLDVKDFTFKKIREKKDEEEVVRLLKSGQKIVLSREVEIIPVENILAQAPDVGMEVDSVEGLETALGILEKGVDFVVVDEKGVSRLKDMVKKIKQDQGRLDLIPGRITEIRPIGLGHRVCVDTISLLNTGQGMLVGNSSAFTFLVNAETEANPYVAARPFRINAGAVHSYTCLPDDKTTYLEELAPGNEVLIVASDGSSMSAVVGRVKTEVRPMLLISAEFEDKKGSVILQNAETIRLVNAKGKPISVVNLKNGDEVLCRVDAAGRHFGMRIQEDIREE